MHDLDVPRIGYIHSWQNTQDEGWVRMAFDKLKVPYTYFGDNVVRQGNLRAKYDVIIYPHAGVQADSEGIPAGTPVPYKGTDAHAEHRRRRPTRPTTRAAGSGATVCASSRSS